MGSVLTNKYAEGYPGSRYYGGCEIVDEVEQLAIERAKALFGAEHANVQPHSGSTANQAIYWAALEPGDRVLAMTLPTAGISPTALSVNFSGRGYTFFHYGVDRETGRIDMDQVASAGAQAPPEAHRGRGQRLSPDHRLRRLPSGRRRGRRRAHGRHGPHRGTGSGRASIRLPSLTATG